MLGADLHSKADLHGEAFNFGLARGPNYRQTANRGPNQDVATRRYEGRYEVTDNIPFHEAGLLKLNCDKALFHLGWEANLSYQECVDFVGSWYREYYNGEAAMSEFTIDQIRTYQELAVSRGLKWTT